MANKSFGTKQLDLTGASGSPIITSPSDLSIKATTVAISTNISVGGYFASNVNVGAGYSIGIGTTIPNSFLQLKGNISTANLQIRDNFFYNITNSVNTNYISTLQFDSNDTLILPNLVSSTFENTGIEWSITNNNNIKLTLRDNSDNTRLDYFSPYYTTNSELEWLCVRSLLNPNPFDRMLPYPRRATSSCEVPQTNLIKKWLKSNSKKYNKIHPIED